MQTNENILVIQDIIIQKIKFTMIAENNAFLPPFTGHLLRGLLYKVLAESDEDLVDLLHEKSNKRPFGLSKLYVTDRRNFRRVENTGELEIKRGVQLYFYITVIGKAIKDRVIKAILERKNENLHLYHLQLSLLNIELEPKKIPQIKTIHGRYEIEFETETQFKTKTGKIYLLPDPEKLFSSITRMVKELLPDVEVPEPKEVREMVNNYVYVRNVKIITREVDIGEKTLQVGFKGKITIIIEKKVDELPENERKKIEWLPMLLYLGNYINIGTKRTVGMGKINVMKKG
jgi:CRISPR-associated endoribonuclease Cas6